jgi:NOL1/NOP2/sun family putative RNA methylase
MNTLKSAASEVTRLLPFPVDPVPWAPGGYYFPPDAKPGKLPIYHTGVFYLQEPSAMAPAAALGVMPGERVLDLCAAPGGKTTQLASALNGGGLLIANDNSTKRIKPLIWNLEHWGATNYVILNEDAGKLSEAFPGFFDKILVDAPCSGEGMLRKEPAALKSWRKYNSEACREIQDHILDQAAAMLAPGGSLVYSTCTFDPRENEEAVAAFLERQPDFHILPLPLHDGWTAGITIKECRQLWPHIGRGEGQFMASMMKDGVREGGHGKRDIVDRNDSETDEIMAFREFMNENFEYPIDGFFASFGGHIYKIPEELPDMTGLRIGRQGWYLGMVKNGRFSPSQPLAMGIHPGQMKRRLDLDQQSGDAERYLRGETLMTGGEKGWTLVTLAGLPLGFGKQSGDYLKNEYPPGWRLI